MQPDYAASLNLSADEDDVGQDLTESSHLGDQRTVIQSKLDLLLKRLNGSPAQLGAADAFRRADRTASSTPLDPTSGRVDDTTVSSHAFGRELADNAAAQDDTDAAELEILSKGDGLDEEAALAPTAPHADVRPPAAAPSMFTTAYADADRLRRRLHDDEGRQVSAARQARILAAEDNRRRDALLDNLTLSTETLWHKMKDLTDAQVSPGAIADVLQQIDVLRNEAKVSSEAPLAEIRSVGRLVDDVAARADATAAEVAHIARTAQDRVHSPDGRGSIEIGFIADQVKHLAERMQRSEEALSAAASLQRSLFDYVVDSEEAQTARLDATCSGIRQETLGAVAAVNDAMRMNGAAGEVTIHQVMDELQAMQTTRRDADRQLQAILSMLGESLERVVVRVSRLEEIAGEFEPGALPDAPDHASNADRALEASLDLDPPAPAQAPDVVAEDRDTPAAALHFTPSSARPALPTQKRFLGALAAFGRRRAA